jgi:hypothetical protein
MTKSNASSWTIMVHRPWLWSSRKASPRHPSCSQVGNCWSHGPRSYWPHIRRRSRLGSQSKRIPRNGC